MKKQHLITCLALLSILLIHSPAHAGTFTAFGPRTFTRGSGKPVVETASFNIKNPNTIYTLKIYNGGTSSEYAKVSSAVIKLNGTTIFGPSDFNQQVFILQKQVTLSNSNQIQVELRSAPVSGLTVIIEGEDNNPPLVAITFPVDGTYINTPSINATGTASDSISWVEKVTVNGTNATLTGEAYASSVQFTEGPNTITGTATDAAGNIGNASVSVILDTIPPKITFAPIPSLTNKPNLTITGKIEDASPITSFTVNGIPATLKNSTFTVTINLSEGKNGIVISATDKAENIGRATTEVFLDTTPPTVIIDSPLNNAISNSQQINVTGAVTDTLSGIGAVIVNGVDALISGDIYTSNVQLTQGANLITVTAIDAAGNKSSTSIIVYMDNLPPVIAVTFPANGSTVKAGTIAVTGAIDDNAAIVTINGINAAVSNNIFTASGITLIKGANNIMITATDPFGNASSTQITVTYALPGLPDPVDIATPIDDTVATTLAAATTFLYSGENPIQTGVAPGTIEAKRAAVLRGRVTASDGTPLSGVRITILNHSEYGSTKTREDGMFDMAVNGGGWITVNYEKSGYLPVQPKVDAPWQDYVWAEDVIMIPYDPNVTAIALNASIPIQVAQGSTITDSDGTRKATLLFQQGTYATMKLSDGSWMPLSNINVRATEYTVGGNGPKAMPAPLPPTSAYTYAVEYSLDEAVTMGGTYVSFSKPVISYTENFLNFPVGGKVPVGYYDREKAAWIPSNDGRIIKILSVTNGLANLDINGSNTPATPSALATLGIADAERQTLAVLYQPGHSLWRVQLMHFSTVDYNWAIGLPNGATGPGQPEGTAGNNPPPGGNNTQCSSIIGCETQTLGETINITGTPFSLFYQSDRTPGSAASRTIEIPISGNSISSNLEEIHLEIYVAGKRYPYTFLPAPNLSYTFTWDGKDAYGRTLQGQQEATIRIGYFYRTYYYGPASGCIPNQSFSCVRVGAPIGSSIGRSEYPFWQEYKTKINRWNARAQKLGVWSLNIHHACDPITQTLYSGNGDLRSARSVSKVVTTKTSISYPGGIAVDAQGNLYISNSPNNNIKKVAPNGTITTIAGKGEANYCGDGGPAKDACLLGPEGVAVDDIGNIYIADYGNGRIRKIDSNGIITTVAGGGTPWSLGNGRPATEAWISPVGVAVDNLGNIYFTDYHFNRVCKVTNGILTTLAGGNYYGGYGGDGGPAINAILANPTGIVVDRQGTVFFADMGNSRIRKITPDGIITTVAGSGSWGYSEGYSGDGGPAIDAKLRGPLALVQDDKGNIFIADSYDYRIRRVDGSGIITTIAGIGISGYSGDNGAAIGARFSLINGLAIDKEGNLLVSDTNNNRIRKISFPQTIFAAQEYVLPSEDGKELYIFDKNGRHLRTIDSVTGTPIYVFAYNNSGLLVSVTDKDGNITTIERGSSGNATAIIAPGGQRTELTLDSNGYLESVANPNGEAHQMTYAPEGLLTTFAKPQGYASTMTYDDLGRLIKDEDPVGGYKALTRTTANYGSTYTVALFTALGRTDTYKVETLSTGSTRRTITDPSGLATVANIGTNGTKTVTEPNGMKTTITQSPDPRFKMQAPLETTKITTPGGKVYTISEGRSISLSDQNNPLSITTMTDTASINGKTFTNVYDAATKKITATTPTGRQRFTLLDAKGRVAQEQTAGLNSVTYGYDEKGRLTTITEGSRVTTMSYDTLNQISSITDAAGRTVSFDYDLAGRVTAQTLPDGRIIAYSYDANGNVTSITPPGRPAHNFTFDPRDLVTYYNPPDIGLPNKTTQYAYNLDKQLTLVTRPDGQTVSFSYDTGGRISMITIPNGQLTYTYNVSTGNLSSITSLGGTITYTYDGRLLTGVSWTGGVNGNISFVYNNDFHVTSESVNSANAVSYTYDNDGMLTGVGSLSISRDAQNGLITGTTLGSITENYSYNSFGEPTTHTSNYGASALYNAQYQRDDLGRISTKTEIINGISNIYTYTYDIAGMLADVSKNGVNISHYEYDTNGNRHSYTNANGSIAGIYDNQDRLVSYGDTTYTYTANGELKSKTKSGQQISYNYDVMGNLTSVTLADSSQIEYVIDGQNRRIGKKVNGVSAQGFLYKDQLKPVAELDGSGNVISRFVYANKSNIPEFMIKGGVTYRIITDHIGSPRLVVNSSNGAIAQQLDFDEYGNITNDTNPGFQPFGFAGGLYDRDTKLTRFGARDYDPEVGRWTATDPIRFEGGLTNLYEYVGDPVNAIDPTGLQGQCPNNQDNHDWVDCYTNCINALDPMGNLAERLASSVINRKIQQYIGSQLPTTSSRATWASNMSVAKMGVNIMAAWQVGTSYGCMLSCAMNTSNY